MDNFLITAAVVFTVVLALAVFIYGTISYRRERLKKSLNLKLLLVRLPQPETSKDRLGASGFKEEINLSEQLFSIFASLKDGAVFEAAVHHVGEEINFYLAVPEKDVSFVSRQIEGLFKDAQIELAVEYNIFQPKGANAGFYLKQDNHYALMLRTYLESEVDTFSPILSGLSRINEVGEGAAIQLIIKPAPDSYKKTIFGMINHLRKGESFQKVAAKNMINLKEIGGVINPQEKKEGQPSIVDQESIKALEKKVSKPLLKINYRVVASSMSQYQTDSITEGITGSFSQLSRPRISKNSLSNFLSGNLTRANR